MAYRFQPSVLTVDLIATSQLSTTTPLREMDPYRVFRLPLFGGNRQFP